MSLTRDWQGRIEQWMGAMTRLFYEPLATVPLSVYLTHDQLSAKAADGMTFEPCAPGTAWGSKWQYGWFKTDLTLPPDTAGKRIVFRAGTGAECAIYVDGKASGAWDKEHHEITLTRKGVAGIRYQILIEAYAGHGARVIGGGPVLHGEETVPEAPDTQVVTTPTTIGIWHEEVYQLWMDSMTLWGLRCKLPNRSLRVQEIDRALREMTLAVDLELPLDDLLKTVSTGRKILKPLLECTNGSTAPTFYCFGHSHIDVAHLWPIRETESKCVRTFGTQLALMNEYKDMTFLQSQPYLYEKVKTKYPKLYARIKREVKKGRWIPEGGMWVEADTNIPGGESLIRQFVHGKRFFREEFGVDNHLLWLPDVFGYSGALPQIMRACGVDYFSTTKITWAIGRHQPFPYHSFWWQGIDGTRVFAHIHNDYASTLDPPTLIDRWNNRRQDDGLISRLVPYGWGDGGGGPTRDHLEYLRRQGDLEGAPKIVSCNPLDFFRDAERRPDSMPTYVGELYFQNHRGTYTSQAKNKQGNRRCEFSLREAELWASVANSLASQDYPLDRLDALWKRVLLNQFHDIIPGSSIARAHREANEDYAAVLDETGVIARAAVETLVTPDRDAITVFNSLSWQRNALVTLPRGFKGAATESGEPLPCQLVDGKTVVRVSDIPSCGWRSLRKAKTAAVKNTLTASPSRLENDYLRISINNRGELISIYDKEHQRELAKGICNQFAMFKDVPFSFDSWNIDISYRDCPVSLPETAEVSVKAAGPLLAVLELKRKLNHSTLNQEIRLEAGSRKIEFTTTIDWQETHTLLKVHFPVDIHTTDSLHEIQFGHLARPTHESNDLAAAQFEVCQQKWTALCENSHGVALLNDCKYGISVDGNVMGLTLLKSAMAPEMNTDRGIQVFTYAFYAWNGPFAHSDLIRQGYELNVQLSTAVGQAKTSSMFSIDQPNVIIEAVKAAEDGSGDLILRLYEAMHMHSRCTLSTAISFKQARATDMLEEKGVALKCNGSKIALDFRPFEIKTIRLSQTVQKESPK